LDESITTIRIWKSLRGCSDVKQKELGTGDYVKLMKLLDFRALLLKEPDLPHYTTDGRKIPDCANGKDDELDSDLQAASNDMINLFIQDSPKQQECGTDSPMELEGIETDQIEKARMSSAEAAMELIRDIYNGGSDSDVLVY
jgi:hypothetical protein